MAEEKKKSKKLWLGVIGLVVVAAILAAVFLIFGAKPAAGTKKITIDVVSREKQTTSYKVKTDGEYLRQAMDDAKGLTYSGEEGAYGFSVYEINGEKADFNTDGAYWAFYVNGDYCNYGVDSQPVYDGDAFRIEYTVFVAE